MRVAVGSVGSVRRGSTVRSPLGISYGETSPYRAAWSRDPSVCILRIVTVIPKACAADDGEQRTSRRPRGRAARLRR